MEGSSTNGVRQAFWLFSDDDDEETVGGIIMLGVAIEEDCACGC